MTVAKLFAVTTRAYLPDIPFGSSPFHKTSPVSGKLPSHYSCKAAPLFVFYHTLVWRCCQFFRPIYCIKFCWDRCRKGTGNHEDKRFLLRPPRGAHCPDAGGAQGRLPADDAGQDHGGHRPLPFPGHRGPAPGGGLPDPQRLPGAARQDLRGEGGHRRPRGVPAAGKQGERPVGSPGRPREKSQGGQPVHLWGRAAAL